MMVRIVSQRAVVFQAAPKICWCLEYTGGMPDQLKDALQMILDTQLSCLERQFVMDAQLHALQIVLFSLTPEHKRLHAAQVLQQAFDEQREVRRASIEQELQRLSLLRATVSKMVQ